MSLPLLIPLLVGGALLGANVARNKDENILEGALKGALLGGGASTLGGALGFGGPSATTATTTGGTKLASSKALTDAMATGKVASVPVVESTSAAALNAGATPTAVKAQTANQLNNIALQQQQRGVLDAVAQSGGQISLTPESIATLQQGQGISGAFSPAADASQSTLLNAYNAGPGRLSGNQLTAETLDKTLQESAKSLAATETAGPMSKLLATAKEKPLETAYFASAVGSALNPQGQTMQAAPYQPGSVQQTLSVEESINQNFGDQPKFIPRPLFESMQGRSPEEMLLLQEQMMARGLV